MGLVSRCRALGAVRRRLARREGVTETRPGEGDSVGGTAR